MNALIFQKAMLSKEPVSSFSSYGILEEVIETMPRLICKLVNEDPEAITFIPKKYLLSSNSIIKSAIFSYNIDSLSYLDWDIIMSSADYSLFVFEKMRGKTKYRKDAIPANFLYSIKEILLDYAKDQPEFISNIPDSFFLTYKEVFFEMFNKDTLPFFSKNVLMNYVTEFDTWVLEEKIFYCHIGCGFTEYYDKNREAVHEVLESPDTKAWTYLDYLDNTTFTRQYDIIKDLYLEFKKYLSLKDRKRNEHVDFAPYSYFASLIGKSNLVGSPYVINELCGNDSSLLCDLGQYVTSEDVVIKAVKLNPCNIVCFSKERLSTIELKL